MEKTRKQHTREINASRSDAIKTFLKKHTDIKRDPLCKKIGYDSSNLLKCMNTPTWNIPVRHLADFERLLKKYGFEPYTEKK